MMLERAPSGFSTASLWRAASPGPALARTSSAEHSSADMMFDSPNRSPWGASGSGSATSQPFTPFTHPHPGLPLDLPTTATSPMQASPAVGVPTPAPWGSSQLATHPSSSSRQPQLAPAPSPSSLGSPLRAPQQQLGLLPAGTTSDTAAMLVSPLVSRDTIASRGTSMDISPAAARLAPGALAALGRADSAGLAMGMGSVNFGGLAASSQLHRAASTPLAPPPGILGTPARASTPTADLLGLPLGYPYSPAAPSAAVDPLVEPAAAMAAAAGSPQAPGGYSSPPQQWQPQGLPPQDPLLAAAQAIQLATPRLYQQHQQLGPMPAAGDALLAVPSDPILAEALRLLLAGVPPGDLQAAGVDMDKLLAVYQRHLQLQHPTAAASQLLQPPQSPAASLAAALGGPSLAGAGGQLSAYEDMLASALAARLNQMDEFTRRRAILRLNEALLSQQRGVAVPMATPSPGGSLLPRSPPGSSPARPGNALYKTELCRSWEETGTCRYGAKCQFAHGRDELRHVQRHPKYKTELCRTFSATGSCPYGTRCRFVHYYGNLPLPEALGLGTPGRGPATGISDADLRAAAMMMSPAPTSPSRGQGATPSGQGAGIPSAMRRLPIFERLDAAAGGACAGEGQQGGRDVCAGGRRDQEGSMRAGGGGKGGGQGEGVVDADAAKRAADDALAAASSLLSA